MRDPMLGIFAITIILFALVIFVWLNDKGDNNGSNGTGGMAV